MHSGRVIILLVIQGFIYPFSNAQTPKKIQEGYEISWRDEFNGDTLDSKKWSVAYAGSRRGIGIVKSDNCYLDGEGHFIIASTKADSNYHIGLVRTRNKFSQQYGYFECRAKVNSTVGPSSAFWLMSSKYGSEIGNVDSSGTEVDILEYRHHEGKCFLHTTVHWDGYGEHHKQKGKHKKVKCSFSDEFHVFGLRWTEKRYTFYVDGKRIWCTRKSISHVPHYIILSLEMNGWGGDPTLGEYPDQVIYDWVRVWKRK